METYDIIIVGSGLGGLTAGAKLSKEGKKVLLIEQHKILGGCATTFKRKGYTMEVSLHEIDGLDEKDPKKEVFDELGVFDHVDFIKTPEFYRVVNGTGDIVIPDSRKEAIKVLTEKFPEEKTGINKFFKTIHAIQKERMRLPMERWKVMLLLPIVPLLCPTLIINTFKTLGDFLDSTIKDENLKLTLAANLGYYHDDPYSMSLIYFSSAQASYFNGGGHYIKGGSQKLSDYLEKCIINNGGKILLKNLVTRIVTKDNKAIGIECELISPRKKEDKKFFAKKIIVNAAVPNVVSMLSGKDRLLLEKRICKLEKSCSLISIYIGFKKAPKEMGNKNYSTFLLDDSVKRLSDMSKNAKGPFSNRGIVFVDYSQIDANLTPNGKSYGSICAIDYLSDWDHLSKEAYKKKKDEVAQLYFAKLEKLIPGIIDQIDYYEVGTPKTIQRYTLNPEGAVYGFSQVPKQAGLFRLPNKSPIKNLYFASAWTNPGGGFTGAILSGWFCANEVNKSLNKE